MAKFRKKWARTGIARGNERRYAREYYQQISSRRARAVAAGEVYVDGRGTRERDWISVFREQTKKSARNRGITFSVTTADLAAQFERQRGRCFYTGIRFAISRTFRGMRQASLDRVDPSRPYDVGNVVWCLVAINYAKNDYASADFLELLEDIRRHRPLPRDGHGPPDGAGVPGGTG
jgi:hypothetical protein